MKTKTQTTRRERKRYPARQRGRIAGEDAQRIIGYFHSAMILRDGSVCWAWHLQDLMDAVHLLNPVLLLFRSGGVYYRASAARGMTRTEAAKKLAATLELWKKVTGEEFVAHDTYSYLEVVGGN